MPAHTAAGPLEGVRMLTWCSRDRRVTGSGRLDPGKAYLRTSHLEAEFVSGNRFAGAFSRDMAVDLGTANTLVYVGNSGIVLNEPSVVAINTRDNRVLAVGSEAKSMIGRTPSHIRAVRPLRDGVIADFDLCEKMLAYFIRRVTGSRRLVRPRTVICVPSGITGVEQRAVQEVAETAGARKPVFIIEEPIAAAIGVGLPVHEPSGNMVVDVGGGTTEVAVISLGGIVTSKSVRIGGDEMDEAIIQFVKKEYSLAVGEATAEQVKITLGSAYPLEEELHAEIRGRDLTTGLPKTIVTTTEEIREAIEEQVAAVVDAVTSSLDQTPPELAADIMVQGLVLTGGGALLNGLDVRLAAETGMSVQVPDNPLQSVVIGGGRCLEEFDVLNGVLISSMSR
jgi:rod shape-determining protein MreB and related proteins